MRQIKFRICHKWGKIKSIIYPCDTFMIGLDGVIYENYGTKEKPLWKNVFDADVFLQQWTGLQDKNGKDIYEGDIVINHNLPVGDTKGVVVQFVDGQYNVDVKHCGCSLYRICNEIEIIGNVFLEREA